MRFQGVDIHHAQMQVAQRLASPEYASGRSLRVKRHDSSQQHLHPDIFSSTWIVVWNVGYIPALPKAVCVSRKPESMYINTRCSSYGDVESPLQSCFKDQPCLAGRTASAQTTNGNSPFASLSFARSYRKKSIRTALMCVSGWFLRISRRMSSTAQMLQPLIRIKIGQLVLLHGFAS